MIGRALVAALSVAVGGAFAQGTIYRCGHEYSHSPCADGRLVDTSDSARTSAQRSEAVRVAASERKLADEMERDRLRAESARPAAPIYIGSSRAGASVPKPAATTKAKKKKKDAAADADFVAVAPKKKD